MTLIPPPRHQPVPDTPVPVALGRELAAVSSEYADLVRAAAHLVRQPVTATLPASERLVLLRTLLRREEALRGRRAELMHRILVPPADDAGTADDAVATAADAPA